MRPTRMPRALRLAATAAALALAFASAALLGPDAARAGDEEKVGRLRADLRFARNLSERYGWHDTALGVIDAAEKALPRGRADLADEVGLARAEVTAAWAAGARDDALRKRLEGEVRAALERLAASRPGSETSLEARQRLGEADVDAVEAEIRRTRGDPLLFRPEASAERARAARDYFRSLAGDLAKARAKGQPIAAERVARAWLGAGRAGLSLAAVSPPRSKARDDAAGEAGSDLERIAFAAPSTSLAHAAAAFQCGAALALAEDDREDRRTQIAKLAAEIRRRHAEARKRAGSDRERAFVDEEERSELAKRCREPAAEVDRALVDLAALAASAADETLRLAGATLRARALAAGGDLSTDPQDLVPREAARDAALADPAFQAALRASAVEEERWLATGLTLTARLAEIDQRARALGGARPLESLEIASRLVRRDALAVFARAAPPPTALAARFEAAAAREKARAPSEQDRAIAAGVDWLVRHQGEDGGWHSGFAQRCTTGGGACDGGGMDCFDAGLTGVSLLALLGAGVRPSGDGPGAAVTRALRYLESVQDAEGCLGARAGPFMTNQALGAAALAEASMLVPSAKVRRQAQKAIDFLTLSQNPYRGWRYSVKPGDNDTYVTGLCVEALRVADVAGLVTSHTGVDGASAWITSITDDEGHAGYDHKGAVNEGYKGNAAWKPHDGAMSAVTLRCRISALGGADARAAAAGRGVNAKLAARFANDRPSRDERRADAVYWLEGLAALYLLEGPRGATYKPWREAALKAILPAQEPSTAGCAAGSWDPADDRWGFAGGRVYLTAECLLALEVEVRWPAPQGKAR